MPMSQRQRAYEMYRRVAEDKYGYEASPDQLAFCVPCVIAETDELAMQEGEKYGMWLFNKALKVRPQFFVPPGYMSERSLQAALQGGGFGQKYQSFKELVDLGIAIAGSPATIIEKLSYYTDVLHAGMFVTGGCTDGMPDYLVLKHQEMMAKEVMPYFRERAKTPEPPAGTPEPVEVQSNV